MLKEKLDKSITDVGGAKLKKSIGYVFYWFSRLLCFA